MSKSKSVKPLYMWILDDDNKNFIVVGPITTEELKWNERVCKLQKKGRHVRCSVNNNAEDSRDDTVSLVKREYGYKYENNDGAFYDELRMIDLDE